MVCFCSDRIYHVQGSNSVFAVEQLVGRLLLVISTMASMCPKREHRPLLHEVMELEAFSFSFFFFLTNGKKLQEHVKVVSLAKVLRAEGVHITIHSSLSLLQYLSS